VNAQHPEPQDRSRPPSYSGGGLRASDQDRNQVAGVLSSAYAEGRLTREEHDERLDQAMAAKTFDELIPLTRDLVYVGPTPGTVAEPSQNDRVDTRNANPAPDRMISILGGTSRKGRWRVRRKTEAYALMGGMELDFTEAIFEAPEVEISGIWCLGGAEITVPPGIEVRNEIVGILGGAEIKVGAAEPGAPVLVLKGVALLGGVEVRTKDPNKNGRKRKRHRH
jgi:hypothetical protein